MAGKVFVQQRRLGWGEADPAGTIYAPRAIDIAIQAIEALWLEALGFTFHELHARHRRGAPWVHTSCEFAAPLRAGEPFEIRIRLERIGATSLTWRGDAARPDGAALFGARLVSVMIDTTNGKSCPILPQIREGLQPYLA
jgi:4-hydroxybenzoyl-CoA thioesterase